jgi:hypothetical protein
MIPVTIPMNAADIPFGNLFIFFTSSLLLYILYFILCIYMYHEGSLRGASAPLSFSPPLQDWRGLPARSRFGEGRG